MKYAYFSGCVTPQRENAYEFSARRVFERLGVELVGLEGASCCGFFLDAVDHLSGSVLAARNLALAEEGGTDILTLCPTCSGYLTEVREELLEDQRSREAVNEALRGVNREFHGSAGVKHLARALVEDVGVEKIEATVTRPLRGLRVAPHYGCHVMKPSDKLRFDDPENPARLDSLVEATGAKCVEYMEERLCCGGPLMGIDIDLALKVLRQKLQSIQRAGPDAIVTICPFCHLHLDLNQSRVEEEYKETYGIPVLHYTQLLGLAEGLSPDDLALRENRVPVDGLLEKLGRA